MFKKWLPRLVVLSMIICTSFTVHAEANSNIRILKENEFVKLQNVKIKKAGPTLFFSDSPETVLKTGILYQDKIGGDIRIFLYHLNEMPKAKRLALVLENNSIHTANIKITKEVNEKPTSDFLYSGKQAQINYFAEHQERSLTIPPMGSKEILSGKNGIIFLTGELISSIIELSSDIPITIKSVCLDENDDALQYARYAPILPPDKQRLRGTFLEADRIVEIPKIYNASHKKVMALELANHESDIFAQGTDPTEKTTAENYGNYGVVYHVNFKSSGKNNFQIYFNPYGGVYAGAAVMQTELTRKLKLIPEGATCFADGTTREAALLAEYKGGTKGKIIFSPAGASNLPIRIIFMPVEKK